MGNLLRESCQANARVPNDLNIHNEPLGKSRVWLYVNDQE